MKSIANQYRDLKEGKMSQSNFMRNLRMQFPQYVTNVTSFNDAVRILKSKAILTEGQYSDEVVEDNMDPKPEEGEDEILAMIKSIEDEMEGEEAVKAQYDLEEDHSKTILKIGDIVKVNSKLGGLSRMFDNPDDYLTPGKSYKIIGIDNKANFYGFEDVESGEKYWHGIDWINKQINKEKISVDKDLEEDQLNEGKGKDLHPNQIVGSELRMGIAVEMEHTDDPEKAKKIALDHLAENPFYYTALKLSGIESPSKKKVAAPKEKKVKKKETVELVDKDNQMKKVKVVKEEKAFFMDLPADPEKYKIKKDIKGRIVQATNDEGNTFSINDKAIAIDNGQKLKIASFKEEQGKVKALFNNGMTFASIDIDGLKPISEIKPGVDMGSSFEKFKSQLERIVREVIAEMQSNEQETDEIAMDLDEYFDGRDNLDAENEY